MSDGTTTVICDVKGCRSYEAFKGPGQLRDFVLPEGSSWREVTKPGARPDGGDAEYYVCREHPVEPVPSFKTSMLDYVAPWEADPENLPEGLRTVAVAENAMAEHMQAQLADDDGE